MKTEILLKELTEIKLEYQNSTLSVDKIDKIIEQLKKDVALENISTPKEKQAYKLAMRYLNKLKTGNRPFLGFANKQEINSIEYTVFTNLYTLYCLKNNPGLPLFEEQEEVKGTYPNVAKLIPDEYNGTEIEILDYKEIVKNMKSHPEFECDSFITNKCKLNKKSYRCYITNKKHNYDVLLDGYDIKEAFEMLAAEQLKVYVYGEMKPILLINEETESRVIILPVRKNDETMNKEGLCLNTDANYE